MIAADSSLEERNRAAFRDRYGEIWSRLQTIDNPVAVPVIVDGVPTNLDLGGTMLYPKAEPEWSNDQLAAFRERPERIGFPNPNHCNLSPISMALLGDLVAYLREHKVVEQMAPVPVVDIGYLFVFGIGLGHHIPELIAETPARHVVLIEAVDEFVLHSLKTIDWQQALSDAEERGISIHFVLAKYPEQIVRGIDRVICENGNMFIEGSFFFPHYYSWSLKEAYARLQELLKTHFISSGYFEDEIEMVRNCAKNVGNWDFHLVEAKPYREQNLPVFIIGAGPSLDRDLPYIRKWREQVIVISCGTALGILLNNGIRPDFQCEIERVPLVYDILSGVRDEFGLDGITLLTTTTVDPRVPGLFEERWYYYRPGLSPTTLIRGSAYPLFGVDPTVCNAAFSVVTTLGFNEIYLFGIDLAEKERGRHHAKGSVYYRKEHASIDETYVKRFNRIVPGNFGGTVRTFWAFDAARQSLAQLQLHRRANLVNCSDGARIDGATPKTAAAIGLADNLPPRQLVLERVKAQMRFFAAGDILRELDLAPYIEGCDAFAEALDELLTASRAQDRSFVELEKRLHAFVTEEHGDLRGLFSLAHASMLSMIRLGAYFGTRIRDEESRQVFLDAFLDHYRERCLEMADTAKDVLAEVDGEGRNAKGERLPLSA